MNNQRLYREQELAFRTQYAELKERTLTASPLLPGTPGTLHLRKGSGYAYWYRVYYPAPGKQSETLVGREDDTTAANAMRERMAFAEWTASQVVALRKLGFQVADKATGRVLVELHNLGTFEAGMVLVGTLGYMAWLNELGAIAVGARTQDIDLARRQRLKLAAPISFLGSLQATGLPFVAVPGLPSSAPSTSVKLPGVQALRVDVLAPGDHIGATIQVPELEWAAQAIPHYAYLLDSPEPGTSLAGGHCIPVRLPQAGRLVWHKLYASTQRSGFPEKAAKDRLQALTLAAILVEQDPWTLLTAWDAAPQAMTAPIRPLRESLLARATAHPELQDLLADCLGSARGA
jgi:hypothetical protein